MKKFLFACAFALGAAFLFKSCVKTESKPFLLAREKPADIAKLRKWFEESWRVSHNSASRLSPWRHDTGFIINNYANLALDWRFAKIRYQGNVKYTEVPANLPDSLQFKIGAADSQSIVKNFGDSLYNALAQSKIFWIAKEEPGQDPYAEIVTFIGDYAYVKENGQRFTASIGYFDLAGYTGVVAYHDRNGQLLRIFEYRRGEIVNTIRCGSEARLDPAPDNRVHLDVCYEILTYERDCVTTYEDGLPNKQCGEWFFVGSQMVGNCFGEGGGGGGGANGTAHYGPVSEDGLGCGSFVFTKTSVANWQEAGVTDIRVKMRWIGNYRSGVDIEFTLGAPVVFGLPITRANGEFYSAKRAAAIAAKAADKALWATAQLLKNEPLRPSDALIEQTFRDYINLFMENHKGTAGRTGSGSPAIVYKSARYAFLGNGNCD